MKILKIRYDGIELFENGIEFDLTATDRVTDPDQVIRLYRNIYTQKVISIIGINATGKTTVLRLINMAMDVVLDNVGLENIAVPSGIVKDGTILTVYFFKKGTFYKLISTIGLRSETENDNTRETGYYFKEEVVYSKLKSTVTAKDHLFYFTGATEEIVRSIIEEKNTFLKDQDSIISAITLNEKVKHFDMIMDTNFNVLWTKGTAKTEFVSLFDHSIQRISVEKDKGSVMFKNSQEEVTWDNLLDINNTLSSGTIKGINLLEKALQAMKSGGYLIVDEIENHMHKKLVQTIIRFFLDPKVNKNGASLIFSTHYAEIIDTIQRKDSINILRKTPDFNLEMFKYSDKVSRNDLKKSEVYLSNLIEGTAPAYEDIQTVRNYLCQ